MGGGKAQHKVINEPGVTVNPTASHALPNLRNGKDEKTFDKEGITYNVIEKDKDDRAKAHDTLEEKGTVSAGAIVDENGELCDIQLRQTSMSISTDALATAMEEAEERYWELSRHRRKCSVLEFVQNDPRVIEHRTDAVNYREQIETRMPT